jgi:hypothetical protein
MEVDELMSMFPSLSRAQVQKAVNDNRGNEDGAVTACIEAQERQGGVAGRDALSAGQLSAPPKITTSTSPLPPRHVKVSVPCRGHVPLYFDSFWDKHGAEFAPLSKKDAEASLFFDKHFSETNEAEGREEILNVLRKLKRRSLH